MRLFSLIKRIRAQRKFTEIYLKSAFRDFSKIPLDKLPRKWYNVLHAGVAELVDAHV